MAVASAALVAVAAPAAVNGAYFPTSWGWTSLAFGWVALLALLLRRQLSLGALEYVMLGALSVLGGWTALSGLWSSNVTQTMLETERIAVYVLGAAAVVLVVTRARVPALLGGVTAGIALVCAYALATRLFPERLGNVDDLALNRLARPIGYWNALALLSVMGALLSCEFAARARTSAGRAVAAAAPVLFLPTLYFTFGRAAWVALAIGLLAMIAVDHRRLQLVTTLLVIAPAPAVVVAIASRSHALTSNSPVISDASHDGHRLVLIMLIAALLSAVAVTLLRQAERRIHPPRAARLAYIGALSLVVVVAAGATVVRYGAPWTIAGNVYDQFTGAVGAGSTGKGANLNKRLFSLSANGRVEMWKVAWRDVRAHPWLGSGAGTYEEYWFAHRPISGKVRDAHSLYLETFAELGPFGLLVLVVLLALPFLAIVRVRRHPFAAAAFGAYVAYLVHAASDWDWELPAVTMTALICAAALLVLARDQEGLSYVTARARIAASAVVVVVGAFALVGLIGNGALSASANATGKENWRTADAQARKATSWAPWSSEGWRLLGESELQQAKFAAARRNFQKAIAKSPKDWNLWLDLALASGGEAKRRAALEALRLNPRSPEIAQNRALARPREGSVECWRVTRSPIPRSWIRRVHAYVAYRLGEGAEADDVTSAVFENAVRYRETYDPWRGQPLPWLLGIARRCIAQAVAARPPGDVPVVEVDVAAVTDLERETVDRLNLQQALETLGDDDRELIALRYGADLSTKKIAELLEKTPNAVDVAMHRALARLRGALEAPPPAPAETLDAAEGRV